MKKFAEYYLKFWDMILPRLYDVLLCLVSMMFIFVVLSLVSLIVTFFFTQIWMFNPTLGIVVICILVLALIYVWAKWYTNRMEDKTDEDIC